MNATAIEKAIEKVLCGFSAWRNCLEKASIAILKQDGSRIEQAIVLCEDLYRLGRFIFAPEEIVFCPTYKSRHITAPQASHCYKTSKIKFYKVNLFV